MNQDQIEHQHQMGEPIKPEPLSLEEERADLKKICEIWETNGYRSDDPLASAIEVKKYILAGAKHYSREQYSKEDWLDKFSAYTSKATFTGGNKSTHLMIAMPDVEKVIEEIIQTLK